MLVVNLFGGPGCGKSTMAAYIYARLKSQGIGAELVTEFAKDLAWEGNTSPLSCQPYIFGQQLWRLERLKGKCEVAVTDSPLLLSAIYARNAPGSFGATVAAYANRFNNANFLLRRVKPYWSMGRFQTEREAVELDKEIMDYLRDTGNSYRSVPGDLDGAEQVLRLIL